MPQSVTIDHPAVLTYHCEDGEFRDEAYREITYPQGVSVDLPSEDWFSDEGLTEYEYLSELSALNAAVIEITNPPDQEIIHGLVRLPFSISVARPKILK